MGKSPFFQKSSRVALNCKLSGEINFLLNNMASKFFSTQKMVFLLSLLSILWGVWITSTTSFFKYMFFLIYVGAILVLIVYLFFSSYNVSSFQMSMNLFLPLMLGFIFLKLPQKTYFSKNFVSKMFTKVEVSFLVFLCVFILLMLACMLSLDQFRFSSLRNLI